MYKIYCTRHHRHEVVKCFAVLSANTYQYNTVLVAYPCVVQSGSGHITQSYLEIDTTMDTSTQVDLH